jgi:hypothetical protein
VPNWKQFDVQISFKSINDIVDEKKMWLTPHYEEEGGRVGEQKLNAVVKLVLTSLSMIMI